MTTKIKIMNLFYCFIILLFIADLLTPFDIKSQVLKSFIYYSSLIGTPLILLLNFVSVKTKTPRIISLLYPTIILIAIVVLNPISILFSAGVWQPQTIIYEHGHLSFKTIELQVQDIGALGYNKRTVEVTHLTPLFMIVTNVPKDIDTSIEWIRVYKHVPLPGIKYP